MKASKIEPAKKSALPPWRTQNHESLECHTQIAEVSITAEADAEERTPVERPIRGLIAIDKKLRGGKKTGN